MQKNAAWLSIACFALSVLLSLSYCKHDQQTETQPQLKNNSDHTGYQHDNADKHSLTHVKPPLLAGRELANPDFNHGYDGAIDTAQQQTSHRDFHRPQSYADHKTGKPTKTSSSSETTPPHMPGYVLDIVHDGMRNALAGNVEYAALLIIEAAEQLPENNAFSAHMYSLAGRYYEQLQFSEIAIAQYRLALTHVEKHPASYNALRRLDSDFAAQHPPLVKPIKKNRSRPSKQQTPKVQ